MTQQEFDSMKWSSRISVTYRDVVCGVVSVNFHERLLGIIDGETDGDESAEDLIWVRCESVELVK